MDTEFTARLGDVSAYIDTHGYEAYASQNVSVYTALTVVARSLRVIAMSSRLMTYRHDVHPSYPGLLEKIASSRSTFVPLDLETCVAETARRQLERSFAMSPEREEQVIRTRLPIYAGLPTHKVETIQPVEAVVAELFRVLEPSQGPSGAA